MKRTKAIGSTLADLVLLVAGCSANVEAPQEEDAAGGDEARAATGTASTQ